MTHLRIEGLTKRFAGKPPTTAMDDLSLEIEEGEFLVLLGPSGCGKTTTLRCLAGLETPDEGRITFGDRDVFDSSKKLNLSPDKRNIGMVFQSYALWPHMTVRKNIGYPLKARKLSGPATQGLGRGDGGARRLLGAARPLPGAAQRRPAAARRPRPRPRRPARRRAVRRAAVATSTPGCATRCGPSSTSCTQRLHFSAVFVTHDQSRGARPRRPGGDHAGRALRAGRHPGARLRGAGHRVRRRVHRHVQPGAARPQRTAAWTFDGDGRHRRRCACRADPTTVAARLRPEDLAAGPAVGRRPDPAASASRPRSSTPSSAAATWTSSSRCSDDRLHARVPTAAFGGWARRLQLDQDVVVGFDPVERRVLRRRTTRRIAGHVDRRRGHPSRRQGCDAVTIAIPTPAAGPRSPGRRGCRAPLPAARRARLPRRHRLPRAGAAVPPAAAGLRGRRRRLPRRVRPRRTSADTIKATVGLAARLAGHRPRARHAAGLGGHAGSRRG